MTAERWHLAGALMLLLAAIGLAWHGQPGPAEKWQFMAAELGPLLSERHAYIEPGELAELMYNDYIDLQVIDVRDERDWNLFHHWGAQRVPLERLPAFARRLRDQRDNGVAVFVGNDEAQATAAWKLAMAVASQPNAYILAGGINRWLADFAPGRHGRADAARGQADETLRYPVRRALGSRHPTALPDHHHVKDLDFPRKVRLQKRVVIKGGCG